MKVLALIPYPIDKGPSQRFRLEVFLPYTDSADIHFELEPFYSERAYGLLYAKGKVRSKAWSIFLSYLRRYSLLFKVHRYDAIYIQREIGPLGFPVMAWLLRYVFRTPYVYDFDDAIWLPNYSTNNARFHRLKMYRKTKYFVKWSSVCSAGNQFLADFALQFNPNVCILPTVVDTEQYHNPALVRPEKNGDQSPVIGWTGTHSTMKYLESLFPIFRELEESYDFELLVISNAPPSEQLKSLRYIHWEQGSEIEDLMKMDLGVMPLDVHVEEAFSKGKCGFKLIQYLSLGIPALASDIGVNSQIIEHGKNGFLCPDPESWKERLEEFLKDPIKYKSMGARGRKTIEANFSVKANLELFLDLFRNL